MKLIYRMYTTGICLYPSNLLY